jgi:hypothetical protein
MRQTSAEGLFSAPHFEQVIILRSSLSYPVATLYGKVDLNETRKPRGGGERKSEREADSSAVGWLWKQKSSVPVQLLRKDES